MGKETLGPLLPDREGDAWQDKEQQRTEGYAANLRKQRAGLQNPPDELKRRRAKRNVEAKFGTPSTRVDNPQIEDGLPELTMEEMAEAIREAGENGKKDYADAFLRRREKKRDDLIKRDQKTA